MVPITSMVPTPTPHTLTLSTPKQLILRIFNLRANFRISVMLDAWEKIFEKQMEVRNLFEICRNVMCGILYNPKGRARFTIVQP